MPKVFSIGDIVETRKMHPCGNNQWRIIRVGADIKIKCLKCGHIVMMERSEFEKKVKKVISSAGPEKEQ